MRFVVNQGGLPRERRLKPYLDMTTSAAGIGTFTSNSRAVQVFDLDSYRVRVVRTIEYLVDSGNSKLPIKEEATLVFRAKKGAHGKYEHGPGHRAVSLPLEMVSSTDPDCKVPKHAQITALDRLAGSQRPDAIRLDVTGCSHHSFVLKNRAPKKPLVQVAISER